MDYPVKHFDFSYKNQKFNCQHHLTHNHNRNRITLEITTDKIIKIKAHPSVSHQRVLEILDYHKNWIYTNPIFQESHYQYINHEKHLYLGRLYPLKILKITNQAQTIQLIDHHIAITVRENFPSRIYSMLQNWYKFEALEVFSERLSLLKSRICWIDWQNKPPLLRIEKLKNQWGSYIQKNNGIITLNQHLTNANPIAIDYVILHELCHAAEFNHSKKFYQIITMIMPN